MSVIKADNGEILWIPCPISYDKADYKRDSLELLDGVEKVSEFNARYGTHFRMGFAKMWLPMGGIYVKERVYLSNLNACIDVIGFHYAQCRVLNLGVFTTSTDKRKYKIPVDISGSENLMFADVEYFDKWGFKLIDYCYRTIRQRIKKLLGEEGVEPTNWDMLVKDRYVRAPGRYTETGRELFTPPQGAPLKKTILLRAEIRAEFSQNKDARKNLPALPAMSFNMIKFSAPEMGADEVCKNMWVYRGNGVRTNILSSNSDFIPQRALIRFDQERSIGSGSLIQIPLAESMSGISVTVSNRKPETVPLRSEVRTRLGSP